MKKSLSVLCVLLAVLCLFGWTSHGQKQNSSRISWEYKVVLEGNVGTQPVNLQAIGAEGWELTAVTTGEEVVGGFHRPTRTYYFKRPR